MCSSDLDGVNVVNDYWLGGLFLPTLLLSGLLGLLAFQADGIQHRVKFYADRGVSPTLVWCTRHWIPVTILLFVAIAHYLMNRSSRADGHAPTMVDTMALLAGSLAAYIVGQWVSQFIKSPILAVISLPAVLATTAAYCIFAVLAMESPWWLLVATFEV